MAKELSVFLFCFVFFLFISFIKAKQQNRWQIISGKISVGKSRDPFFLSVLAPLLMLQINFFFTNICLFKMNAII